MASLLMHDFGTVSSNNETSQIQSVDFAERMNRHSAKPPITSFNEYIAREEQDNQEKAARQAQIEAHLVNESMNKFGNPLSTDIPRGPPATPSTPNKNLRILQQKQVGLPIETKRTVSGSNTPLESTSIYTISLDASKDGVTSSLNTRNNLVASTHSLQSSNWELAPNEWPVLSNRVEKDSFRGSNPVLSSEKPDVPTPPITTTKKLSIVEPQERKVSVFTAISQSRLSFGGEGASEHVSSTLKQNRSGDERASTSKLQRNAVVSPEASLLDKIKGSIYGIIPSGQHELDLLGDHVDLLTTNLRIGEDLAHLKLMIEEEQVKQFQRENSILSSSYEDSNEYNDDFQTFSEIDIDKIPEFARPGTSRIRTSIRPYITKRGSLLAPSLQNGDHRKSSVKPNDILGKLSGISRHQASLMIEHAHYSKQHDKIVGLPNECSPLTHIVLSLDNQTKITPITHRKWKRYLISEPAKNLLCIVFWYVFLQKWHPERISDVQHLKAQASTQYVKIFLKFTGDDRDVFFQSLPDIYARATFTAFRESYPQSHKWFDEGFQTFICDELSGWFSGIVPVQPQCSSWTDQIKLSKVNSKSDDEGLAGLPPRVRRHMSSMFKDGSSNNGSRRPSYGSNNRLDRRNSQARKSSIIDPILAVPSTPIGETIITKQVSFNIFQNSPVIQTYLESLGVNSDHRTVMIHRREVQRVKRNTTGLTYHDIVVDSMRNSKKMMKNFQSAQEEATRMRNRVIKETADALAQEEKRVLRILAKPQELKTEADQILESHASRKPSRQQQKRPADKQTNDTSTNTKKDLKQ